MPLPYSQIVTQSETQYNLRNIDPTAASQTLKLPNGLARRLCNINFLCQCE
jgi:hypothetical protein